MRLLMVTHAETEWNAQGRFLGHTDVPLNEAEKKKLKEDLDATKKRAARRAGRPDPTTVKSGDPAATNRNP